MRAVVAVLSVLAAPVCAESISAVLEPAQMAEMRATVAGRISDILVVEGAVITKGQLIATMDGGVQDARVALAQLAADSSGQQDRAEALVGQAQGLATRVTQAQARGAAQAWEVNQANQAVRIAQADQTIAAEARLRAQSQLDLERAILSEFEVRAPFDGTVLQIYKEPGEIIDTQEILIDFGYLRTLEATAFFPVNYLGRVVVGDTLRGTVETGASTRDADLAVIAVDPRIDPASRTFRVTLALPNNDRGFPVGATLLIDVQ